MNINKNEPVAISRVESYDTDKIEGVLRRQFDLLGITELFKGKKIAIKPNMVMKKSPEAAATTHPAILEAVIRIVKEHTDDIIIAESPGGVYTESLLRSTYKGCHLTEVAEKYGVKLNLDTSYRQVSVPEAETAKVFNIISPMLDADVIINLAKLKSHSLTTYSGAVKNYFGTIPGVQKFETHARFPDYNDFGSMLVDLCAYHVSNKETVNILDGILAMEGNGPTAGSPRKANMLLCGRNPFNVDVLGSYEVKLDGIIMLENAKKRGFCVNSAEELEIICDEDYKSFVIPDFKKPATSGTQGTGMSALHILPKLFGGKLYAWFQPKPVINKKACVGCGECARSCPKHTIKIIGEKDGHRHARIDTSNCIKCFCCQELCPFKAVKIKKNPILKIIAR